MAATKAKFKKLAQFLVPVSGQSEGALRAQVGDSPEFQYGANGEIAGVIFATQKAASAFADIHIVVDAVKKVTTETGNDENTPAVIPDANENAVVNPEWLLRNREAFEQAFHAADPVRPPLSDETKAKMKAWRDASPEEKAKMKADKEAAEAAAKAARAKAKADAEAAAQ